MAYDLDNVIVWAWLRDHLLQRPEWVGERVGIPELASLPRYAMPKPPLRLSAIAEAYKAHSPASDKSKREALAAWEAMVAFTGAVTSDDLTDAKLATYRADVVGRSSLTSSGTVVAYFAWCKSVIKLAGRGELDAETLAALLARMKAKLYSPPNNVQDDPRPISRDGLHKLLTAAADGAWRAWLLLGLNAALYCEDVCDLKWASLDLDAGTFAGRRRKRGTCIRAATLWPETTASLRAAPQRGESPYVFVSSHGTRYNRNTRINDFRDFADNAKCPDVTFSHLRDGAYTAATHGAPDERWARLLAGHAAPGLTDKYVLRNPECVRPACEAVYSEYGPFPSPTV